MITNKKQLKEADISSQARKYLSRLTAKDFDALDRAISEIPKGSIKPLKGFLSLLRLDVSSSGVWYRIIFEWIDDSQIHVLKIKPRGDVYKGGL